MFIDLSHPVLNVIIDALKEYEANHRFDEPTRAHANNIRNSLEKELRIYSNMMEDVYGIPRAVKYPE